MKKDLTYTLFDSPRTNDLLTRKQIGAVEPKESMQNTINAIPKLNNLCDESIKEILNGKIKLDSKDKISAYSKNLQRLFEDITTLMMSTNSSENLNTNAQRWQETIKRFLNLYLTFLNEMRKKTKLLTKDDQIEYSNILVYDFLPDIQRANYQLPILLSKDQTIPRELKNMINDYI